MRKHIKKALNVESIRFASIGVINTFIDFTILNILVSGVGIKPIPANVISASVAMSFSYFANRTFVFKSRSKNYHSQMVKFIAGTLFGLYVLQTLIIYEFTEGWMWPGSAAVKLAGGMGLGDDLSREFIITNAAKVVATAVTLIWNYFYYKKVVFKE